MIRALSEPASGKSRGCLSFPDTIGQQDHGVDTAKHFGGRKGGARHLGDTASRRQFPTPRVQREWNAPLARTGNAQVCCRTGMRQEIRDHQRDNPYAERGDVLRINDRERWSSMAGRNKIEERIRTAIAVSSSQPADEESNAQRSLLPARRDHSDVHRPRSSTASEAQPTRTDQQS